MDDLGAGGSLLYGYRPGDDGVAGTEGAFLACSFWLVQALAVTGRVSQATELFRGVVGLAGPLGLHAEEIDPATGRHLGNYPKLSPMRLWSRPRSPCATLHAPPVRSCFGNRQSRLKCQGRTPAARSRRIDTHP